MEEKMTTIRLPQALLDKAERAIPKIKARYPHMTISRSTVLRMAIDAGLDILDSESAGADLGKRARR